MSQLLCHDHSYPKLLSPTLYPDVYLTTLDGQGKLVSAHRVILVTVSTKFEEIFCQIDDAATPVIVRNIRFEILEKIINLVYRGNIDIEDSTEEDDMWDGLHMLRMVDHNMGIIHGICHSRSVPEGEFKRQQIGEVNQNCTSVKEEKSDIIEEDLDINHCTGSYELGPTLKKVLVNVKKKKKSSKPSGGDVHKVSFDQKSSRLLNKFNCDFCPESFNHPTRLRRHLRTLHKEQMCNLQRDNKKKSKTFVCDICHVAYKYQFSLRRHLLQHDETERDLSAEKSEVVDRISCLFCDGTFKNKKSQGAHHRNQHSKEWNLLKGHTV